MRWEIWLLIMIGAVTFLRSAWIDSEDWEKEVFIVLIFSFVAIGLVTCSIGGRP